MHPDINHHEISLHPLVTISSIFPIPPPATHDPHMPPPTLHHPRPRTRDRKKKQISEHKTPKHAIKIPTAISATTAYSVITTSNNRIICQKKTNHNTQPKQVPKAKANYQQTLQPTNDTSKAAAQNQNQETKTETSKHHQKSL
ncbi:hypothetical protein EX30DRAFT_131760 [Ascodesmis nigricans]|uniref:Uncharacterized protein n=1 Tax=Ascodesmis nigricans TaxID=341454 RepID=A0A4V3SI39_9PEZI|nr:hypothetical protein EX30DRAFT_131760 [Ascodesmis nigricans]